MIDLLALCRSYSLPFRQMVEVGVNHPKLAQARAFLDSPLLQKAILVEPLARHARRLRREFRGDKRVTVICAAACEVAGPVRLFDLDQSSFLVSLQTSPAVANGYFRGRKEPKVEAVGITFDSIDDGQIDVLAADVEGAEWFILKHLRSRPLLICLETHLTGHPYVNPYLKEIKRWMRGHGYSKVAQGRTDTVWMNRGWRKGEDSNLR